MKYLRTYSWLFTLLSTAILLAACAAQTPDTAENEEPPRDTAATEVPKPQTSETEAQPPEPAAVAEAVETTPELSERTEFAGFGFSIAHPAGWLVALDEDEPVIVINELAEDHETALLAVPPPAKGYGITLDHRDMLFMRDLGLPEEPSLQDLFEMNRGYFQWPDSQKPTETELFGVPALVVKAPEGENWTQSLMGFANEEAFLLTFTAPTKEAFDAYLPVWEQMLASIEPVSP